MSLTRDKVLQIANEKVEFFLQGDNTFKVYGPYERKDGRKHVIITPINGSNVRKRTVSWPRLLAEIYSDGDTYPTDTVDHIDRNFINDDPYNLRMVPLSVNCSDDALRVKVENVNCTECNSIFTPTIEQIKSRSSNKAGPFCSRSCTGKYAKRIQNGAIKEKRQEIVKSYFRIDKEI